MFHAKAQTIPNQEVICSIVTVFSKLLWSGCLGIKTETKTLCQAQHGLGLFYSPLPYKALASYASKFRFIHVMITQKMGCNHRIQVHIYYTQNAFECNACVYKNFHNINLLLHSDRPNCLVQ